jgi:hypothetical protein
MTNDLLNKKLAEMIAQLDKFAAAGANPKALQPMIETTRAAQRRLAQFADAGPEKLTARDEVALRMLPMAAHADMRERMARAYQMADMFLQVRHETQAEEFMG